MRTNLIMHFHCSECGSVLNLVYPDDAAKPEEYSQARYQGRSIDEEPTGATVRYVSAVHVEPCRGCIEKHTGPAKKLTEALKAMGAA